MSKSNNNNDIEHGRLAFRKTKASQIPSWKFKYRENNKSDNRWVYFRHNFSLFFVLFLERHRLCFFFFCAFPNGFDILLIFFFRLIVHTWYRFIFWYHRASHCKTRKNSQCLAKNLLFTEKLRCDVKTFGPLYVSLYVYFNVAESIQGAEHIGIIGTNMQDQNLILCCNT